jgi:hypothetical protein
MNFMLLITCGLTSVPQAIQIHELRENRAKGSHAPARAPKSTLANQTASTVQEHLLKKLHLFLPQGVSSHFLTGSHTMIRPRGAR